jgi:hypothetical protein
LFKQLTAFSAPGLLHDSGEAKNDDVEKAAHHQSEQKGAGVEEPWDLKSV